MNTATATFAPGDVTKEPRRFDAAQLARETYLTVAEGAWYCAFRAPETKRPTIAFYKWVTRRGVPKCYVGRSLRFLRRDLDRAMAGRHDA